MPGRGAPALTGQRVGVTTSLTRTPAPARESALSSAKRPVLGEAARFLLVGGAATVLDVGVFNLLHYGLDVGPLTSKVASTVVGGLAAFVGNRQWSFQGAAQGRVRSQVLAFLLVNLAALGLALLPLAVARYGFGLTGVVALNTAGNVIGLAAATALRFWGYRRYVFVPVAPAADDDVVAPAWERAAA